MNRIFTIIFLCGWTFIVSGQNNTLPFDNDGNTASGLNIDVNSNFELPAKGNSWKSFGPFGGDVFDIAFSPSNPDMAFAAAGYPYYRDGVDNDWMIDENLLNLSPSGIHCFEYTANNVLLAGGNSSFGKIYRSTDDGASWTQKIVPYNGGILDIAVDPSNPDVVYAALSSNISGSQNKVIAKSEDGGELWSVWDMTSILPVGWGCVNIAVDPNDSQTIYAIGNESFSNAKVIATFDGGSSWQDVTGNIPSGKPLNVLAIDNDAVYIGGGQLFGGNVLGLYKSTDSGSSWQNISSSFPNKVVNDILIDQANTDNMYVATEGDGVYITHDGGSNWTFNTAGAGDNGAARCLQLLPDDASVVYAGFLSLGICYSENGGVDWMSGSAGISSLDLNDIEIDPNNPVMVLAAFEAENSGGCYIFDPGEGDWSLVDGLPATRFSKVSIGIDGSMYAWSNGPTTVGQEGLYKSTDGGENWDNKGPNIGPVFETQIFALVLSQTDPDLIYIGGNNFGANGWASMIYRSTDGGDNWDNIFQGPDNDSFKYLYIDPNSNDQTLYAAFSSNLLNGVLMKSIDGGDSWLPINSGIPSATKWAGSIISDPQNSDIVYAGIGGYGGIPGTVYKSEDGGSSWLTTNLTLANYSKITDMMISPVNSEIIYAASSLDGVYFTQDALNWEASNDDLPASNITAFSSPFEGTDDWRFYASTFGNSAFWTTVFGTGTSGINSRQSETDLLQLYPNPSNSGRVFVDLNDEVTQAKLSVYNSAGVLLRSNYYKEGTSFEIFVSDQPGMYIIELKTDDQIHRGKVLISE